jgi:hypothetical protein
MWYSEKIWSYGIKLCLCIFSVTIMKHLKLGNLIRNLFPVVLEAGGPKP